MAKGSLKSKNLPYELKRAVDKGGVVT